MQSVPTVSRCSYPSWFTQTDWTDLQGEHNYRYDVLTDELVIDRQYGEHYSNSYSDTNARHVCHQKVTENDREVKFITKATDEW